VAALYMAGNPTTTSPETAAALPQGRTSDLLLIEVAKLQSDGEYIKRDLGELRSELRSEMRDVRGEIKELRGELGGVRDCLTRLEERVAHLPGKGFIVAVVSTALVLVGGVTTIAPRLQSLSLAPSVQQPAPPVR
jgi:hypothetical protein